MENRKELLKKASSEVSVDFLSYTRLRPKTDGHIFVFEGKDDPKFYTPHILSSIKSKYEILSVNGKSNVLGMRKFIREHPKYKSDSTAFLLIATLTQYSQKKIYT